MLDYDRKSVENTKIEKIFGQNTYRRIVAYRNWVEGQLSIEDEKAYSYYAIITSDKQMKTLQIIEYYNQRECEGEHHFKELDFNWNKLPFDAFEMNTVHLFRESKLVISNYG